MAITKEFLRGLNVPEEAIHPIFAERGKEITAEQNKYDKLVSESTSLRESLEALKAEKESLMKNVTDLEGFKEKWNSYEKSEKEKTEAAARAAEDAALTDRILTSIGDKKFTNDFAKEGVIRAVKSRLKEDSLTGIDKILEEVTKDKVGIFDSPQSQLNIPSVGNSVYNGDVDALREAFGLPPRNEK